MTRTITIELDDDDFDALQLEFARKQKFIAQGFELPEGDSCLRGAMIGEIVRDLWEYREIWEASNPNPQPPFQSHD